jgi:amino-acid N-acetyltransferase
MAGVDDIYTTIQQALMAFSDDFEFHPTQTDEMVFDMLEEAGLATSDLKNADVQLFEATVSGKFVGFGGFELYGTDALLRSVVVHPDMRRRGFGTRICLELEDELAESMCRTIYLLTSDASGFFEQLGYEQVERASVPDTIGSTHEFTDGCPSTARCMVKTI